VLAKLAGLVARVAGRGIGALLLAALLGVLPSGCSSAAQGGSGESADTGVGAADAPASPEGGALHAVPLGSDAGASADADAGEPAAPNLGAPCASASDCVAQAQSVCWTGSYFAGGYCTAGCATDADCGPGGVCVRDLFEGPGGNPVAQCLEGCSTTRPCRSGYVCDTTGGVSRCLPNDCRVAPSVCATPEVCNQNTGGCTPDAPTAGYPAAFPAPPQVADAGGPVLAHPVLVPIFFSNDQDPGSPVADMVLFYEDIGATNYWKTMAEYGVGAPGAVVPVMLAQAAPATIDDTTSPSALSRLLAGLIQNGTDGMPKPTADTVYVFNFPLGTSVTIGSGASGQSCVGFLGYHFDAQIGSQHVAYAVVPRCAAPAGQRLQTNLQVFTTSASHEITEASNDPFPSYSPAWSQVDGPHIYFDEANGGSEIADMCEQDPETNFAFADSALLVQRIWSNASALAGHDPCAPALPGTPFFNTVPVPNTKGPFTYDNGSGPVTYEVDSVHIPVGQSATIPLDFYSDAPTAPWSVTAADYRCVNTTRVLNRSLLALTLSPGNGSTCQAVNNPRTPCVTQECTGQNGSTADLTLTVNATGGGQTVNGQVNGSELYVLTSTQGTGSTAHRHIWFGVVTN
jgi:hypothetical protein